MLNVVNAAFLQSSSAIYFSRFIKFIEEMLVAPLSYAEMIVGNLSVVVLRADHSLSTEDLIAHCRTQIAGYKCPRSVEFRTELPLSAAGKILKYELRAPFWAGRSRHVN
jgi:acyl-coenzyme A synthetase/AMP-(fatty) acid ligase